MPERPPRKWFLVSVSDAIWLQHTRLQAGPGAESAAPGFQLRRVGPPENTRSASSCPVSARRAAPRAGLSSHIRPGVQVPGQRINPCRPSTLLIWSKRTIYRFINDS